MIVFALRSRLVFACSLAHTAAHKCVIICNVWCDKSTPALQHSTIIHCLAVLGWSGAENGLMIADVYAWHLVYNNLSHTMGNKLNSPAMHSD